MLTAFLTSVLAVTQVGGHRTAPSADSLLQESLSLMGGQRLADLRSVRWTGMASEELSSASEWASPPVAMYREFTELRDLAGERLRSTFTIVLPQRSDPIASVGIATPAGTPGQAAAAEASLALGPERVLLAALAEGDATIRQDTVIGGKHCRTVTFRGGRVTVYLSVESRLPVAVEVVQSFPENPTLGMWGDIHTVTLFQAWALTPQGIRLPLQLTTFRNGRPFRRVVIRKLELGAPAPSDSFPVDSGRVAAARARAMATPWTGKDLQEMAEGVVFVPGPFNMMLVGSSRGVLVIGAPYSEAYSRGALAEAERRFPGVPITGVVLPSGTWPHIGGVREFIARGIPVYAAGGTADVVAAVAVAPHTIAPDSLARVRTPVILHRVDTAITLGAGPNRVRLLPNRGPGAAHESQLVVYLPGHRFVFAGDLYLPQRFEPNLWRQSLDELRTLLGGAGITPERVAAMHFAPTPWAAVRATLETGEGARP